MIKKVFVVMCLLGVTRVVGQNKDLLNVEFSTLPTNSETVSLKAVEVNLKVPKKLKKGILINGFSFSSFKIDYEDGQLLNTNELEDFKSFSYSLSYLEKMNKKWSYTLFISPKLNSNFESDLTFDDINFNGGIVFNKTTNSSKLSFGLAINSGYGLAIPIPIVSFSKQVSEQFSYVLGIPVMKAKYQFNKRNKASIFVKPKGFIANLSNNIQFENGLAKKANYMSIITGLNYNHSIDDCWGINLSGGYQLYSNYSLQDNNRTEIYDFNTSNGMYASIGLNFNLINNKKQRN